MESFIRAPSAIVWPVTLRGDDRTFSWNARNTLESRAIIQVDLDRRRVDVTIRPSCGVDHARECVDAKPVNDALWGNGVHVHEDPEGRLVVDWDLNQSFATLFGIGGPGLQANGSLNLTPPGTRYIGTSDFRGRIRTTGDGFPSYGLYFARAGVTRAIIRRDEGTTADLLPLTGDWSYTRLWP